MHIVGSAHILAGGSERISDIVALVRESGLGGGTLDMFVRSYVSFGIDEARDIRDRSLGKSFGGGRRIFVLAMPGMTAEAQNALLKTLEEPRGDALFFFILPSPRTLLPTLLSRVQELSLPRREGGAAVPVDATEFLRASPAARLDMLRPLLEKREGEGRDIGAVVSFLAAIERAVARPRGEYSTTESEGIAALYRARRFATDKGALLKPLLEQVALLMPVV